MAMPRAATCSQCSAPALSVAGVPVVLAELSFIGYLPRVGRRVPSMYAHHSIRSNGRRDPQNESCVRDRKIIRSRIAKWEFSCRLARQRLPLARHMATHSSRQSVSASFENTAAVFAGRDFLHVPAEACRGYADGALTLTYGEARARVEALSARLGAAGYGPGHRVALALDNRPEFFLYFLALARLNVSIVPDQCGHEREGTGLHRRTRRCGACRDPRRARPAYSRGAARHTAVHHRREPC